MSLNSPIFRRLLTMNALLLKAKISTKRIFSSLWQKPMENFNRPKGPFMSRALIKEGLDSREQEERKNLRPGEISLYFIRQPSALF
jgi:hypothetical protein